MLQKPAHLTMAILLLGVTCIPVSAAEREDVRKVINLVTSVKMPYPETLTRNRAKTERVWLERGGTTTGCVRFEDRRWCTPREASFRMRSISARLPSGETYS
jgi:hypothetical protein